MFPKHESYLRSRQNYPKRYMAIKPEDRRFMTKIILSYLVLKNYPKISEYSSAASVPLLLNAHKYLNINVIDTPKRKILLKVHKKKQRKTPIIARGRPTMWGGHASVTIYVRALLLA